MAGAEAPWGLIRRTCLLARGGKQGALPAPGEAFHFSVGRGVRRREAARPCRTRTSERTIAGWRWLIPRPGLGAGRNHGRGRVRRAPRPLHLTNTIERRVDDAFPDLLERCRPNAAANGPLDTRSKALKTTALMGNDPVIGLPALRSCGPARQAGTEHRATIGAGCKPARGRIRPRATRGKMPRRDRHCVRTGACLPRRGRIHPTSGPGALRCELAAEANGTRVPGAPDPGRADPPDVAT